VGGFGEVWKARNPHFDGVAPVALKFCLDSTAKERLLRHEAVILNQVMRQGKHQGIVQLLHTYLSAEPPCLAYEYIEDGDLAGVIKEKKLKADTAAKIMLRLAEIVGFAHRLNPPVVHRDLKPANILVRQTKDKKFVLKVADFGIGGLAAAQAIGEVSRGTSRGKFLVSALQGAVERAVHPGGLENRVDASVRISGQARQRQTTAALHSQTKANSIDRSCSIPQSLFEPPRSSG